MFPHAASCRRSAPTTQTPPTSRWWAAEWTERVSAANSTKVRKVKENMETVTSSALRSSAARVQAGAAEQLHLPPWSRFIVVCSGTERQQLDRPWHTAHHSLTNLCFSAATTLHLWNITATPPTVAQVSANRPPQGLHHTNRKLTDFDFR